MRITVTVYFFPRQNHVGVGVGVGVAAAGARVFLSLLKALKAWAKSRGAERILVHVTTGESGKDQGAGQGFNLRATHRLLEKVGAEAIGGGYVV